MLNLAQVTHMIKPAGVKIVKHSWTTRQSIFKKRLSTCRQHPWRRSRWQQTVDISRIFCADSRWKKDPRCKVRCTAAWTAGVRYRAWAAGVRCRARAAAVLAVRCNRAADSLSRYGCRISRARHKDALGAQTNTDARPLMYTDRTSRRAELLRCAPVDRLVSIATAAISLHMPYVTSTTLQD